MGLVKPVGHLQGSQRREIANLRGQRLQVVVREQHLREEPLEPRSHRHRQLIVAMGNHVYLRLQDVAPQ